MSAISRRQIHAMVGCANGLVAGRINSITPAEVDPLTTLVSAEATGTALPSNYRVDLDARAVTDDQRRAIERSTRAMSAPRPDMVRTIGYGGSYRYVWRDRAGVPLQQLLIDRCP